MKKIYFLSAILLFNITMLKAQEIINPVAINDTTFTPDFGTTLTTTFDGTGLETFPSLTANHEGTSPGNSFVANETTGTVDFDLGEAFAIEGLSFWNQNAGGPSTDIGLNSVVFSSSLDGIDYTPIDGSPTFFAEVTINPAPPETFTFTAVNAAFIRLEVLSNHGAAAGIGFAEIAFSGDIILGIDTPSNIESIRLYPNPSNDFISIKGSIDTNQYLVYDMLGKKVLGGTVAKNERINIQNLNTGIYLLKLNNSNPIKFIKN